MTVQAWLIFNDTQRAAAEALNDSSALVIPRLIDNPLADNLGEGVLLGKFVAPGRILNDPYYVRWVPSLSLLPIRAMDSDILFLPPTD